MRSKNEQDESLESVSYRELRLLTEVQRQPKSTQRELARRLGIALGMTNLLLHNLGEKGYVRISRAGWKRWMYALTPEGFSRKLQLTLSYIRRFLDQYQKVRQSLREELAIEQFNSESRVAIYGTNDFAELVYLGLKDLGIEEIEVFDRDPGVGIKFVGLSVQEIGRLQADQFDRIVVAFPGEAKAQFLELREAGLPPEKLVLLFTGNGRLSDPVDENANS